ncbi:DUF2207 domain-containing protein [Mycoplana dimorpha]|uniref:Putative membrane protein DUF2207 n=1 Tax=Mycoplana dimorpha TaxID=28320 RepID=A0A2T5BHG3_MYCDI|nr:DUF2207 domain-containing protein [Mycoplana dimorpha]PTM98434.1 putative membrane protein DUF2207 [Mycoplana dimorpha]
MSRIAACLLFLLSLLAAGAGQAAEIISSFHADIEVARDGELTVTETIEVNAEGNLIRRGIYRDFPLTFVDAEGRSRRVGFEIVEVRRDGKREPYHTEEESGAIRIYFGSADVLLDPGPHTYELAYRTDRQIRYFDSHDELFWNVTGTEWAFPIRSASATVALPDGVEPEELTFFTGPYGATGKAARARISGNEAAFSTTGPLGAHEGLTIGVKMAAGSIDRPSADQEWAWFLRDNAGALIGIGGLVLVALYYLRAWIVAGRDPAAGVVVPQWHPPQGASPALVNYIDNKGFGGEGWTALSAALLNLAVKGYVTLSDLKNSIVITRTDKPVEGSLPSGEDILLKSLAARGDSLAIDKANGKRVQTLGTSFRQAMEKEHRNKYYVANWGYIAGGVALSALFLLLMLVFGNLSEDGIALVVVPAVAAFFLAVFAVSFGKSLTRARTLGRRIMSVLTAAFFGFVFLSIFGAVLAGLAASGAASGLLPILLAVGGIILLNLLFYFLMGAPTPIGRKMMDGIAGLRQYLTLAEKERMNMAGAPEMSPRHYEALLPYAVALGVEKPWSDTFQRWLATAAAGAAAAAYQPSWYSGDGIGPGDFADRMGGFAGSMADTITASLPPPPKSSSSGFSGSGSSGGGGGGGGGGGW